MLISQSGFPLVGSIYDFKRHPKTGGYFNDLMPYTAQVAEDICLINHELAVIFLQTGSLQVGWPSRLSLAIDLTGFSTVGIAEGTKSKPCPIFTRNRDK